MDGKKQSLTDLMLAMDIVDNIRHRQRLLKKDLNTHQDEQQLKDKIKKIYQEQGIDVTEQMITDAITAMHEQRFVYKPPKKGLVNKLAHFYVQRKKWGKRAAIVGTTGMAAYGAHYQLVEVPKKEIIQQQIEQVNQDINGTQFELKQQQNLWKNLTKQLKEMDSKKIEASLKQSFELLYQQSVLALAQAKIAIENNINQSKLQSIDHFNSEIEKEKFNQILNVIHQDLNKGKVELAIAQKNIAYLKQFNLLPKLLEQLKQHALAIAKIDKAKQKASKFYQDGISGLHNANFDATLQAQNDFKDLIEILEKTYKVKIINKQNKKTGVYRIPDSNYHARNYYIIVEAINKQGKVLTMPIHSEETNKTTEVNTWGIRVDKDTFYRIAEDKQDDGIIQNNIVAIKKKGYLTPQYKILSIGGEITQW